MVASVFLCTLQEEMWLRYTKKSYTNAAKLLKYSNMP